MHTISCILLYMLSIVQTNLASPVTSFKNSTHRNKAENDSVKCLNVTLHVLFMSSKNYRKIIKEKFL